MKKVILTVNQNYIGDQSTTFGGLVRSLNPHCDLSLVDSDAVNFNFTDETCKVGRYQSGRIIDIKDVKPEADLWIFYSDGYHSNLEKLGYENRLDYLFSLFNFMEKSFGRKDIKAFVNSPVSERKTLKSYFSTINHNHYGIIPTYSIFTFDELNSIFKDREKLVAKPVWGGGMNGVSLIDSEECLSKFESQDLSQWCFQDFYESDIEKRLWFLGGRFVGGRIIRGRNNPWTSNNYDSFVEEYTSGEQFNEDLELAIRMVNKTGIDAGSIDFIGDKINEVNGAGTGFTTSNRSGSVKIDYRDALYGYLIDLVKE